MDIEAEDKNTVYLRWNGWSITVFIVFLLQLEKRMSKETNRSALASYYFGILSILPILGIFLGPLAVFFSWKGLNNIKEERYEVGRFHSWTGLFCGAISFLMHLYGMYLLWREWEQIQL